MNYISLPQLLALHGLAIKRFGGSEGIRDMGRLESALAAQQQEIFGTAVYASIFEKAAAVCRGIIGDHPFIDGNKRSAMLVALTLLEINAYRFTVSPGEIEDFAVQVAVEHLDVSAIASWLESHSQAA